MTCASHVKFLYYNSQKNILERFQLSKRESFLLRIDPRIMAGLKRWADDDLRSVNGQIEYILKTSLVKAGRLSNLPESASEPTNTNSASKDTLDENESK